MRKIILSTIITFLSFFQALSQEKLPINTETSTIKWIGELTFHFGGHDGFIEFEEGYFIKEDDVITGGEFTIDMNSMTNSDIKEAEGKKGLIDHLKDADFFNVASYPKAKLKIIAVEYFDDNNVRIYANMTIKEVTKKINFNAKFNYEEKTMFTKFKIDRRAFNVNYKSKFKNGAISDAIGFEVKIQLK